MQEYYHPGFVAKRMELGAVIAATPRDHVRRAQPEPGDIVMLLGGRTGRDGCGGATGSSKAHNAQSLTTCGAEVQTVSYTHLVALSGRGGRQTCASCRSRGAAGLCGGGAGGSTAGLKQEVKSG